MLEHLRYADGALHLLDQRVLPLEERWIVCESPAEVARAITDMVVRGAPAIGVAAAYGMAMAAAQGLDLEKTRALLLASRPTAVNLRWALERLAACSAERMLEEALEIHREDVAINRAIGEAGAELLPDGAQVYHHCNTGTLATGGWGTALGIIRSAHARGKLRQVWVGETRPYLQGARLTAYELLVESIPCALVTDSTAASLMASGRVDAVLVGCDRVAANGDTANKIGTLGLAVLAKHFGVPFYVAMPLSTLDARCPDGSQIPIELRGAEEVRGYRDTLWAPPVEVHNPAFDVTPAALITGWVTERGLWSPTAG
ncbi:MAG: S-methyl-5-thioribose-1-phosphate isomerase [Deltaproteobacteria bacterium]|nr:MAG: S-methyl-5-thioribose-1-phosphate isomerase [Deltaproteobacteria bacterium]